MRFLIIGLGSIGQRHYKNLRSLGFSDIAVYRTGKGNAEFVQKFEREHQPEVFHNSSKAFRTMPNAVFIANPTALHAEFISTALRNGASGIFVEKPIGHKIPPIEAAVTAVEKKNIVGYVGYNLRFHSTLQKMKKLVEEGLVGKVISASVDSGEYLPDWHPWEDYRSSYTARKELGGGVTLTQSHDIDYLYWFFGMPLRVTAFYSRKAGLDIEADALMKGILEYPDGTTVSLHMDFYRRPPRRIFEIMGSKGTLRWSYHEKKLEFFARSPEEQSIVWTDPDGFGRNAMFMDELRHFIACLEGREKPKVTFRDGLGVLRVCDALLRSSESGEVINL